MVRFLMICWIASLFVRAEPSLVPARPFADHMVLPMGRETPVWGVAAPGAEVALRFGTHSARGMADTQGNWRLALKDLTASGEGRELEIVSGNERLITDLVHGWRKVLAQPDLPFFMVQLPRIGGDDPLRRGWPRFRAVQAKAVAKLNHVSLIETVDLGWDSPDVHPPDKRPVGERLGKAAAR